MNTNYQTSWIAFAKGKRIASGVPREAVADIKKFVDAHADDNVVILDARTSETVEVDLRGSLPTVLKRLPVAYSENPDSDTASTMSPKRTVGRPKLGVTAREVTLLPRHWEWLNAQPGGASTALRKLVEQALRSSAELDRLRQAQEAAYRFMNVMAGDRPGFEEAARALFAGDIDRLPELVSKWPLDIKNHALILASAAVTPNGEPEHAPKPNIPPDCAKSRTGR